MASEVWEHTSPPWRGLVGGFTDVTWNSTGTHKRWHFGENKTHCEMQLRCSKSQCPSPSHHRVVSPHGSHRLTCLRRLSRKCSSQGYHTHYRPISDQVQRLHHRITRNSAFAACTAMHPSTQSSTKLLPMKRSDPTAHTTSSPNPKGGTGFPPGRARRGRLQPCEPHQVLIQ